MNVAEHQIHKIENSAYGNFFSQRISYGINDRQNSYKVEKLIVVNQSDTCQNYTFKGENQKLQILGITYFFFKI